MAIARRPYNAVGQAAALVVATLCASAAAMAPGCSGDESSEAAPSGSPGAADSGAPPPPAADRADANADAAVSTPAGADAGVWSSTSSARLSAEEIVLGVCRLKTVNPDGTECTGLSDLIACASDQCSLDACVATCDDYVQCVLAAEDQCVAADTCPNAGPCFDCIAATLVCSATECTGLLSCGSTTRDGPCDRLETCCRAQPDDAACLGFATSARMLGGDDFCQMLIDDPGFIDAYASGAPCML